LKDIDPKGCSDESRYWIVLAVIAGVAYLIVCDAVHGPQLWTSDGTPEGTVRVSDVKPPGFKPFSTSYAGTLDDVHYFYANDRVHGTELWRTDGTRAGTRLVKDIWKGPR
jgi:ELWxxDGT repeat protein